MFNFLSTFFAPYSKLEILDLVLSVPILLFLVALMVAIGISLWRSDEKFHQHIRKMAFKEIERGTTPEKVMRLSLFYIVFTAFSAYLGMMYFALSLGIITVMMTCFSFYFLAVFEQVKRNPASDN